MARVAWGNAVNAQSREINRRVLANHAHGQGAHDDAPVEGCPACELTATGAPLACPGCQRPTRSVGECADCLFRRFDDEVPA